MVWYKNIRVKKVTQSSKVLNDHLFLLQDVTNSHWRDRSIIHSYLSLGITTCSTEYSRNVLSY